MLWLHPLYHRGTRPLVEEEEEEGGRKRQGQETAFSVGHIWGHESFEPEDFPRPSPWRRLSEARHRKGSALLLRQLTTNPNAKTGARRREEKKKQMSKNQRRTIKQSGARDLLWRGMKVARNDGEAQKGSPLLTLPLRLSTGALPARESSGVLAVRRGQTRGCARRSVAPARHPGRKCRSRAFYQHPSAA